jgi:hypothetical protein
LLHIHKTITLKHYLKYLKYTMLIKALVDYNIWCLHMVHNTIYVHSEYEDIINIYKLTNIHIGILRWRTHIYIFKGMVRQEQEWEYKYLLSWRDSSHTVTNNHCLFFACKLCLYNNRCLFFHRLKINHESHEFILDFGTVANSYIYCWFFEAFVECGDEIASLQRVLRGCGQ